MSTRIPDTVYIWRRFTEINLVIEIRLLKVEENGERKLENHSYAGSRTRAAAVKAPNPNH